MTKYLAIAEECVDGGYQISFPDFPNLATECDNFRDIYPMAKDCITGYLEGEEPLSDPQNKEVLEPLPGQLVFVVFV
jgi:predicted RNase H-like HicB family nuclease